MAKDGDAALSAYQHLVRVQQGRRVYVGPCPTFASCDPGHLTMPEQPTLPHTQN